MNQPKRPPLKLIGVAENERPPLNLIGDLADIQKKNDSQNDLTSGTQTSKRGSNPSQIQDDTNPAPYVKPKVKPKTISEAVEDDNNYLGAMYNNLIEADSDFLGGMTRLIAKSNPYGNPIMKATADVLGDKTEQVTEKLRSGSSSKKYEEEIQQGFDLTKGVFTKENAKALPLMISRFAGDMGLAIPTAGASYLAQGYSQGLKEFDRAVGNRTTDDPVGLDNAREIFGIAYSTISSVADRYSLGFMTKSNPVAKKVKEAILKETVQELATKTTGKITADVIEETASRIAKKGINKFKSVGLKGLASAGVEGGTEGITGLSTDILKGLTNVASNLSIFNEQEVVEDFWKNRINEIGGGAVLGGITGSALRGMKSVDDMVAERVSSATNKETLYEIASELKKELSDRYNDGSLDADRWNEIGTNLGKYIKATEVIPFDIGDKKRKEAIQAIVERDKVAEAIKVKQEQMSAYDESLAPQAQQEIDILEAKKQSLNDDVVEATQDEKFKYSKDPEKDKWYKQLGEDKELEEISKQQYELETQSVPKEKAQEVTPLEKPTIDTEEQIIAEGQQAEADFQATDDLVTYEQKMKKLDDRANQLIPEPTQEAPKAEGSGVDGDKIFYHGTPNKEFNGDFDERRIGERDSGFIGRGFYFTEDKSIADQYQYKGGKKGKILERKLDIKNPLLLDKEHINPQELSEDVFKYIDEERQKKGKEPYRQEKREDDIAELTKKLTEAKHGTIVGRDLKEWIDVSDYAKSRGYDAIIGSKEVVVFDKSQIKQSTTQEAEVTQNKQSKPQEDAVNQGNIEQSNITEREGVTEQQQGQQEDRKDQEESVTESQTTPSNRNIVSESREVEEVNFAKSEIEKGAITWDGDRFSPRPDLGIEWTDIRKGQKDILAGKDTVPARRLIKAINKAREEGGYTFIQGSGGIVNKMFVPISEAYETSLTSNDIAEITANEAQLAKEYDDWFNNLSEEEKNQELNFNEDENIITSGESKENVSNQKDAKVAEGTKAEAKKPTRTLAEIEKDQKQVLARYHDALKEAGIYEQAKNGKANPNAVEKIRERFTAEADALKAEKDALPKTEVNEKAKTEEVKRPIETPRVAEPKGESAKLRTAKEEFAKVAERLRALKIDTKGKSFDATLGLPVAVWNGAVETVASAVEAGVALADAIKRGLNYIQKNHRGQFNEKEFNDIIIKAFSEKNIDKNTVGKVDESGKKFILYHSSTNVISGEYRVRGKNNSFGIFFSPKTNYSQVFGDITNKVKIEPKKTLVLQDKEAVKTGFFNMNESQYNDYLKEGFDSIAWYRKGELTEFIVIEPSIIKDSEIVYGRAQNKTYKYNEANLLDRIPILRDALSQAKDNLKQAKAKLDSLNNRLGISSDPEQKAKALFEYHKALVNYAIEYIKDVANDIAKFAKEVGLDVSEVKDAWKEASGGKELKLDDFVTIEPIKTSDDFTELAYKNIESDEFRDTLSNKERESGRELTPEEKRLAIQPLLDAFKLGTDIIEKAKEEFGDKYVQTLLDYIRDNEKSLGVDKVSLILISLENDLNKQMLDDPDNLTIKKQERMVQNIAIAYQRTVARALGYGKLRQIARVGYDIDRVTDEFFSTKQKEGKRKLLKAIESNMDDINAEAELQEQEVAQEQEDDFIDLDIQRLIEEGVESELAKLKVTMPTKRREQADKAIKAIDKFQKKLKGLTYEATVGVPIAIIDGGLSIIKTAIDKGVNVADAIELGIKKIKRDFKKDWANEDKFRQDMLDFFKSEGIETKVGKKILSEEQKRKMYIKRLEKDLTELDEQIEAKKRNVVTKEDKYKNDKEIQGLRDTKQAKLNLLNQIDPSYAESVKLKNDLSSAQRSLEEYERKISENDFNPNEKPNQSVIDAKLKDLRDKRDKAKEVYQAKKKAYNESLITPKSVEETKIDREIKSTENSIAELERKLAEKDFGTNTKTESLWTEKLGELRRKQFELKQKLQEERNKLIPKETPKSRLEKAKERVKARIEELQQQIVDKKKELKIRGVAETDAELVALREQEKQLKEEANKYLTQESIDRINESKEKAIVTRLENELADLDEQIAKGEKERVEKKEPKSTPQIEALRAQRKAKIEILNELDPNPKEFTKQALIDAGYSREITVTLKDGTKEKRQVLDWKKLAGEEGSIDNIREVVENALKDKGFTDAQISRMRDAFVTEFNELRANIATKAIKELRRLNEPKEAPQRKSSARRLAELYDLGLFEQNSDEFDYLVNKAIGLSDVGQEAFFEAKRFAASLSELYKMNPNEFFTKQFVREINFKIAKLLNKVAFHEGGNWFKFVNVASEIFNLMLRAKLQTLKQFFDNQISGRQERLIQDIGGMIQGELSTKQLDELRKKYASTVKEDITKNAGLYFGDVNTPFLTKSQIEDYLNSLTKDRLYHHLLSVALGKSYLEGADSMNKASLTEKTFIAATLKVLTDKSNPNKMKSEDALKMINEQLTGQKFSEALNESERIIKQINQSAGREILSETKENIFRGAMDLVKANLLVGQALDAKMIEASYNAAYKSAGYGLGHEANNPISEMVNQVQARLDEKIKKAVKEKKWGKAANLTILSTINRNILNPFVGGGTNWLVLGLQKSGLDVVSPLWFMAQKMKNGIDLSNPDGIKDLENELLENFRRNTINRRVLIGGIASSLFTLALISSGGDDEMEEWLAKNKWAKKYQSVFTPQLTLLVMAYRSGQLGDWVEDTFARSAKFEKMPKIIQGMKEYNKGTEPSKAKAYGVFGNAIGSSIEMPLVPVKFLRDLGGVYKYIVDKPQAKSDFMNVGFANGFFNYGAIDYMGFRPDRTYMRNIEEYIPKSDEKTIKFLRSKGLDINADSDQPIIYKGFSTYMSEEQAQKYDKKYGETVYGILKDKSESISDLSENDFKKVMKFIKNKAKDEALKTIGAVDNRASELTREGIKYILPPDLLKKRTDYIETYIRKNKSSIRSLARETAKYDKVDLDIAIMIEEQSLRDEANTESGDVIYEKYKDKLMVKE